MPARADLTQNLKRLPQNLNDTPPRLSYHLPARSSSFVLSFRVGPVSPGEALRVAPFSGDRLAAGVVIPIILVPLIAPACPVVSLAHQSPGCAHGARRRADTARVGRAA